MLTTPTTALKAFFLNGIGDLRKSLGDNVRCRGEGRSDCGRDFVYENKGRIKLIFLKGV